MHAHNLTSVFDYFVHISLKCWYTCEVFTSYRKSASMSGDKFVTGSRINVLTAHVQTLLSQKSPKMIVVSEMTVSVRKWVH